MFGLEETAKNKGSNVIKSEHKSYRSGCTCCCSIRTTLIGTKMQYLKLSLLGRKFWKFWILHGNFGC